MNCCKSGDISYIDQKLKLFESEKIKIPDMISSEQIQKLWNESDVSKATLPPCCSHYVFYRDEKGKIRRI